MRTGAPENLAMSKLLKHNKKGKPSPKGKRSPNRKSGKIVTLRVPGNAFDTDAERVTLKFTDQYLAVQGASGGSISSLLYGINTPKQPNRTSNTGVPQGWASMIAKFGKYVCHGSTINWRITRHAAGTSYGSLGTLGTTPTHSSIIQAVCYPAPFNTGSAVASVRDAAAQKYASVRYEWARETGSPTDVDNVGLEQNPRIVWKGSMAMSPSKIDGEPNLRMPTYEAAVGSDPTAVSLYAFVFQDVISDATYEGVFLTEVTMTYDVTFFERLAQDDALKISPIRPLRMAVLQKKQVPKEESKTPVAPKSSWSLL
jgi:hypothetical protein